MADAIAEREVEVQAALAEWDSLPPGQCAPAGFRDLLAQTQADFVSVGRGLEWANSEIERLYLAHPEDRPAAAGE